jgi:hypothetical protein
MRKLYVFLAVLAIGIAILVWVDSLSEPVGVAPAPAPGEASESAAQRGVLTEVQDTHDKASQVALSGPLDVYTFDNAVPGKPLKRAHLVADDCATVGGGEVDLRGARLELFEPASGVREVEARAVSARAKLRMDPRPALDEGFPITLRETTVTYEVGSRFAPLEVTVPELRGVVALDRASSDGRVQLEGRGLKASGTGLDVEQKAEKVTLRTDPRASIELEDGSTADLASRGALTMQSRPELGPEFVELELRDDAHTTLTGTQRLRVDSDRAQLVGRMERGAASRLRPVRGEANGNVRLTPEEGSARGEHLVLEFDEQGSPLHAALDGAPKLDVVLRGARLENVPPELLQEGETLTVELDGAGPLEFFYDAPRRLQFTGPARVRLPSVGATLECDGDVTGATGPDGRLESLVASENARLAYADLRMNSRKIAVRTRLDDRGRVVALLESEGPTVIAGTLADGSPLELVASGGLSLERSPDSFVIREARAVVLALGGRRPVKAKASVVRDFDASTRSFEADGEVEVENEFGRGRGQRFVARSAESGELAGSSEERAHFEFESGTFDAQFVDVSPGRVVARGSSHATFEYDALAYDLTSEWVSAQRVLRPDGTSEVEFDSGDRVHVEQRGAEGTVTVDARSFYASAVETTDAQGRLRFEPQLAIAQGDVEFDVQDPLPRLHGRGGRLELRADRSGRLEPEPGSGAKVELTGRLAERVDGFDLRADSIDFARDRLVAVGFDADLTGIDLAITSSSEAPPSRSLRAVGGFASIDRRQIVISGGAYLGGERAPGETWSIDAERIVLRGHPRTEKTDEEPLSLSIQDLVAEGGVRVALGALGRARAHVLVSAYDSRDLTLAGDPSSVEEREAVLDRAGARWYSTRFDLDLDDGFFASQSGRIQGNALSADVWTLSFDAIEPLPLVDQTVQILRQPVWKSGGAELRANWALAWVDPARWRRLATETPPPAVADPDAPKPRQLSRRILGRFALDEEDTWLHELFLDGDVEYLVGSVRKARAESVYLDMIDGHGWVQGFLLAVELPIGSRDYQLKVQANWVRASVDGTMRAVDAIATTCTFDVPDYVVHIDEFTIKPRYAEGTRGEGPTGASAASGRELAGWQLELDGNQLEFLGGFGLPIPKIDGPLSRDYEFDEQSLTLGGVRLPSFGSDSKLGAFISTSFSSEVGVVGRSFHWLLERLVSPKIALPKLRGRTRTHVDLHTRGPEIGFESDFESPGHYVWEVGLEALLDGKRDRGLVRVDEDDRDLGRAWLHTRGRVLFGRESWIDAVLTRQTDAGVQAEFFERDFLAYDEHESYLHWRLADETSLFSATVEARLENYRDEIVDQPALGWYRGRSEIGILGTLPVVQSLEVTLDHHLRKVGDPNYRTFFGPPFADVEDEREVLRSDARERVELPWNTGFAGVRVVPFLEARATGWSENAAEDGSASRAALIAGVQTSTTLWRTFDDGSRHLLTPSLRLRGDAAHTEDGGAVALFDAIDQPIEGEFADVALRSYWENREMRSDLDLELMQTYAQHTGAGVSEGWWPLATRVAWLSEFFGTPYGLSHDARYDTASGLTDYSNTYASVEPIPDLDLQIGYHSARNTITAPTSTLTTPVGSRLFDALSVGSRYRLSPKWEVEGRETFTLGNGEDNLNSSLSLRRFGHDFVFEIESSYVAGEGASTVSFHFTPLFAWRRSELSQLDRWRATRR